MKIRIFFLFVLSAISCNKEKFADPSALCDESTGQDSRLMPYFQSGLIVEPKNSGLLIDFSETWCPPCGSYGGPGFDSCLSLEGIKITAIKVYGSSSPTVLNSAVSTAWASDYGVSGVPDFWFNHTELNPGGGVDTSASANYNWVNTKANLFAVDSVVAGVSLSRKFIGDSVLVKTRVKFFQPQQAGTQYSLAVYIAEDSVISNQSTINGAVQNYRHRNLLRSCNSVSYTGVPINNGSQIQVGQIFDSYYILPKRSLTGNNNNLKAIGVIWKLGSTPAKVVNSNVVK